MTRNDPCWCGSGAKWKKCHFPKAPPETHTYRAEQYLKQYGIIVKNSGQIAGIRRACKLAATILDKTCKMAKAGVTTNELDSYAHQLHLELGVTPAPLGYGTPPFPKSICTSLNEVICHGIPDDRPLQEGDIVNIDVACSIDGFYGDCSTMVCIGKVDADKQRVVDVSLECLNRSIAILKPGVLVCEIGDLIEDYARTMGCSVVHQFAGHGVGIEMHEPPQIPHHYNRVKIPLVEGMTFTIEPMINAGVANGVLDARDGWTVRTEDGRPSAQWEHSLLITASGYEILTKI
ncbi:MAG: methionyl aminopeptidase [Chlamydiales bacterium]